MLAAVDALQVCLSPLQIVHQTHDLPRSAPADFPQQMHYLGIQYHPTHCCHPHPRSVCCAVCAAAKKNLLARCRLCHMQARCPLQRAPLPSVTRPHCRTLGAGARRAVFMAHRGFPFTQDSNGTAHFRTGHPRYDHRPLAHIIPDDVLSSQCA